MLLITLGTHPVDCRIELDGHDISRRVSRIELDADTASILTVVRLTIIDDVTIAGTAGRLEFQPRSEPTP